MTSYPIGPGCETPPSARGPYESMTALRPAPPEADAGGSPGDLLPASRHRVPQAKRGISAEAPFPLPGGLSRIIGRGTHGVRASIMPDWIPL